MRGVEDGDDRDRAEVVDHCEGEEECPQRDRQAASDDCEDCERKGDVGCHGDAPASEFAVCHRRVHGSEEQCGYHHAAEGRGDGNRGARGLRQGADDELMLELEPHDEEEHREQSVCGPRPEREVQTHARWTDLKVDEGRVGVGPGGVGPQQGDGRREEQQAAADCLVAKLFSDPSALAPAQALEEGLAHRASSLARFMP
ncbi:unannotated protein [freshwater metagenome]|uniref:Unannotated protein n=1 Tax=freshwater metagenome TaxID=449393 RepID=A0A6J6UCZ4_9ZZZZ